MQGKKKPDEKPPGDAPPLSAPSPGAPSSSQKPQETKKDDPKKFEEYHVLAPGKTLRCAAGLVRGGDEVTAATIGEARLKRLIEVGTVVTRKRRIK